MRIKNNVDFSKEIKENMLNLHRNGIYLELDDDIYSNFKLYTDVKQRLEPYNEFINDEQLKNLDEFINNFKNKMADEIRLNKNLKIVFGGQSQSGISSFLNALIYGKNHIFDNFKHNTNLVPYKICYGSVNKIEIEFYTKEDWRLILKKNEKNLREDNFDEVVLRNIYKKAVYLEVENYLGRKITVKRDCTDEEFINRLDDYISCNGDYAAMVKNVTIYTDNEELKGIEILELLGTKDPIKDRAKETDDFISNSDILFFFSCAGKFMDNGDIDYLKENILNKGAKNIVFVGSKFDDVLLEEAGNFKGNLDLTVDMTFNKLKKQAIKSLNKLDISDMRYKIYDFENSAKKIEFVSTISHDIANNHYIMSELGKEIFRNLNNSFKGMHFNRSFFKKLSNVDRIKREYLIKGKEEKTKRLKRKCENLLKNSDIHFKNSLKDIKMDCISKMDFCESQKVIKKDEFERNYKNIVEIVDKTIQKLV